MANVHGLQRSDAGSRNPFARPPQAVRQKTTQKIRLKTFVESHPGPAHRPPAGERGIAEHCIVIFSPLNHSYRSNPKR